MFHSYRKHFTSSFYRNKKVGWTEEQEEELRQLFEENQSNPSNEQGTEKKRKTARHVKLTLSLGPFARLILSCFHFFIDDIHTIYAYVFSDVIDWILDNLIDKSRTRRAVIKKMKEMGLIFKAPTRKSVADAVSKHLWRREEDAQLKELYDEHRLEDGQFKKLKFAIFFIFGF